MKSAYLYVRVSTDEQKRKGYSLPEQEDRLLRHCEQNDILVKGIFREDYSAKNFFRPEWTKLLVLLESRKQKTPEEVLFIKWDRFSRNIEYAYQMLGTLRGLNVQAMAIDQPIDFSIPESTVMLAVYLSIPEAENSRRALNVKTGMRRAKLNGRWMSTAPLGYDNMVAPDGRKYIAPKEPEATMMRQAFEELSKGRYNADQVRKILNAQGLVTSSTQFWRNIRNPVYCGYIIVPAEGDEPMKVVKGLHESIIDETLYYDVQDVLNGNNRKVVPTTVDVVDVFPLRGFLKCPKCHRMLTASSSKGRSKRYFYYHCQGNVCDARFHAEIVNDAFEQELSKYQLSPKAAKLFKMVVMEEMESFQFSENQERKKLKSELMELDETLSSARKKYVMDALDESDFKLLKEECTEKMQKLEGRLADLPKRTQEKKQVDAWLNNLIEKYGDIINYYRSNDTAVKRQLIGSMYPENLCFDGDWHRTTLIAEPLSLILLINKSLEMVENEKAPDFSDAFRMVVHRGIEPLLPE